MKNSKFIFLFIFLFVSKNLLCMQEDVLIGERGKKFEINGVLQTMSEYVRDSLADHYNPFSVTKVYRYASDKFIIVGDILNVNDEDLIQISEGNFVYVPNFLHEKTRLSREAEVDVGAIIIGTRNYLHACSLKLDLYSQKIRIP